MRWVARQLDAGDGPCGGHRAVDAAHANRELLSCKLALQVSWGRDLEVPNAGLRLPPGLRCLSYVPRREAETLERPQLSTMRQLSEGLVPGEDSNDA